MPAITPSIAASLRQTGTLMGTIEKIYVTDKNKGLMRPIETTQAVAYSGLKGDRYFTPQRSLFDSDRTPRKQDLTLISAEEIGNFNRLTGMNFGYGDFRRNVITRGIDLNTYVGKYLKMGDCIVFGIELCEPCRKLARELAPLVFQHLVHKAGLRCAIITSGELAVQQTICEFRP